MVLEASRRTTNNIETPETVRTPISAITRDTAVRNPTKERISSAISKTIKKVSSSWVVKKIRKIPDIITEIPE